MRERLSAAVLWMAIPLYLSFSFLDWIYAPNLWPLFFGIRVGTSLVFAWGAMFLSKHSDLSLPQTVRLALLLTGLLGLGIGYMTHATGGFESPYYAGLNWIAIGSLAFWPGPINERLLSLSVIYLPLFLMEILFGGTFGSTTAVLSMTFVLGTALLSVLSNILSFRSLKREFDLRRQLQNLIHDKDRIIEVKSAESANLKRLAKQFSPAVIQAIESREISLDQRNRRKVAVMFLDVVGSTNRSNSIDHGDYQKVMDMFFEMVIKKLLQRNITVANFLGDGLMAIANAPFPLADFEKIAYDTAIEILQETARRQRGFREYWHDDFHVRIGISSGFANVGFFPNSDFGVYTAIGESVNLAARLCSATDSSSIATVKQVMVSAGESVKNCTVKRGGSIGDLKGFKGHEIEFFIAKPKVEAAILAGSGICPLCGSGLSEESDLGDCVVVKCKECRYTDIVEKSAKNKKAA